MTDSTKPGAGAAVTAWVEAWERDHPDLAELADRVHPRSIIQQDAQRTRSVYASAYIAGQRSRDAEVERLQKALDVCSEVHNHNVKLKADRDRLQRELLAPTYYASNNEDGDGQTVCELCDESADDPHTLTECIANLRSERDSLLDGDPEATGEHLARAAHAAIMKDLLGRCGIENAFDGIDASIRAEIDAACIAKATVAITAALARGGK